MCIIEQLCVLMTCLPVPSCVTSGTKLWTCALDWKHWTRKACFKKWVVKQLNMPQYKKNRGCYNSEVATSHALTQEIPVVLLKDWGEERCIMRKYAFLLQAGTPPQLREEELGILVLTSAFWTAVFWRQYVTVRSLSLAKIHANVISLNTILLMVLTGKGKLLFFITSILFKRSLSGSALFQIICQGKLKPCVWGDISHISLGKPQGRNTYRES